MAMQAEKRKFDTADPGEMAPQLLGIKTEFLREYGKAAALQLGVGSPKTKGIKP